MQGNKVMEAVEFDCRKEADEIYKDRQAQIAYMERQADEFEDNARRIREQIAKDKKVLEVYRKTIEDGGWSEF